MSTEKDLKPIIETLTLNQAKRQPNLRNFNELVTLYRLKGRKKFSIKLNIVTICSLLPFLFGFGNFALKNKDLVNPELFKKTLPALSLTSFKTKLNPDTWNYIYRDNVGNFFKSNPQRFEESSITFFLFGQPKYVANILNKEKFANIQIKKLPTISNPETNFLLLSTSIPQKGIQNSFLKGGLTTLMYDKFDELPAYLDSVNSISRKQKKKEKKVNERDFLFDSFDLAENTLKNFKTNVGFTRKNSTKKLTSFFNGTKSNSKISLINSAPTHSVMSFKTTDSVTSQLLKNNFYRNRFSFYQNLDKLNNELKRLFINKKIIIDDIDSINDNKTINYTGTPIIIDAIESINKIDSSDSISDITSRDNSYTKDAIEQNDAISSLYTSDEINQSYDINTLAEPDKFDESDKFDDRSLVPQTFSQNSELFQIIKEIIPENSELLENIQAIFSEIEDVLLQDLFLEEFAKTFLFEKAELNRLMSGYKYPDMETIELKRLEQRKLFFRSFFPSLIDSKSLLFKNTLIAEKYHFKKIPFPTFLVETKKVVITDPETNRLIYDGPSVILDETKLFDWKTQHKTPTNSLEEWCFTYLSPQNPLQNFESQFFGNSQLRRNERKKKTRVLRNKSLLKRAYLKAYNRDGLVPILKQNKFVPFTNSLHIADSFTNKVFKNSFVRGIYLNLGEKDNQQDNQENVLRKKEFLPIIQIQLPKFTNVSNKTNYYSSLFDFQKLSNLDYTTQTKIIPDKKLTHYKKISSLFSKPSIFSKTKKKNKSKPSIAVDNWEPLTRDSWLIITQVSFAFFVFEILKDLGDLYGRELLAYLIDFSIRIGFVPSEIKDQLKNLLSDRTKGFRIWLQTRERFEDIVGIEFLLPGLFEILLYLRSSGRASKNLPRGVLLTGPPGTGKTYLVKAIATEAQVPLLVISGNSLIDRSVPGLTRLRAIFEDARKLAPCIVFIDEVDSLASKRPRLAQNAMGDDLLEVLEQPEEADTTGFKSVLDIEEKEPENKNKPKIDKRLEIVLKAQNIAAAKSRQRGLLMRLLIELDGINPREGVVIIGATNRPEVLDPAVLRPGRFDRIISVPLPNPEKRVDILKFYGKRMGYSSPINWDYLAARTEGFSAADLAGLINESAIKAVINQTCHTIETIEHGIDRITTCQSDKSVLRRYPSAEITPASQLNLIRLAYYQAGKIVVSELLENHPKVAVAYLWPRTLSDRVMFISRKLEKEVFRFTTISYLNTRITGAYAGKAAECLFLEKFSASTNSTDLFSNLTTLGTEDIEFGQRLIYSAIEKSSLYNKKYLHLNTFPLETNTNTLRYWKDPQKLEYFEDILEKIDYPPIIEEYEDLLRQDRGELREEDDVPRDEYLNPDHIHYEIPWWQEKVSYELESMIKNVPNWHRFYLYSFERNERNTEWVSPDDWIHCTSSSLKNVRKIPPDFIYRNKNVVLSDAEILGEIQPAELSEQTHKSEIPREIWTTVIYEQTLKTQIPLAIWARQVLIQIWAASLELWKAQKNLFHIPGTQKSEMYSRDQQRHNLNWNDLSKINRDYQAHSLILQALNECILLLNQNREIVDKIVIALLKNQILRKPDIEKLVNELNPIQGNIVDEANIDDKNSFIKPESLYLLEPRWGRESRKKRPKWIDFREFK